MILLQGLSVLLVFVSILPPAALAADFACNVLQDSCPTTYNGVCESEYGTNQAACLKGDCGDCDQCVQFSFDCQGCTSNGCYFCPGDATCYNSNLYTITGAVASCNVPSEYTTDTCQNSQSDQFFDDPLYQANAWIWDMIDIAPVWTQAITGNGIRVRVNDNGVDVTHPEFQGRFDEAASCDNILPTDSSHGTSVASIVLAGSNNNECSVGVAPDATLSVCNVFDGRSEAFLADKVTMYDISQNSIGILACGAGGRRDQENQEHRELQTCPFRYNDRSDGWPCANNDCDFGSTTPSLQCEQAIVTHCQRYYEQDVAACLQFLELFIPGGTCSYNELTSTARDAFTRGILQGRDGKGIIYVFAAGNSFQYGDDVNFSGFTNTRFAITVGAVGKDGRHASYSTPGASTLVVGPGGDHGNISNHVTANAGGGCHDPGVGTSLACPVVSGVVALMLQVNPDLTWRDVQGILAQTSKFIGNDPNDATRHTNAAGLTHSHLYGFGIVNANAAVETAKTWQLYTPEKLVIAESGILNERLVDDPAKGYTSYVSVVLPETSEDFIAESVEVYIALQHLSRGDLEITLQSPSGTESILHPGQRPETTVLDGNDRWKLLTVRSWGETAKGVWQMTIRDLRSSATSECIDEPWGTIFFFAGSELTCDSVENTLGYCGDGNIYPESVNPDQAEFLATATSEIPKTELTIAEACCACGGGKANTLLQWRMVVYGRAILPPPTEAPTAVPSTTAPVVAPTVTPSLAPVDIPTVVPTEAPTTVPTTTAPVVMPTVTPSMAPVAIPTFMPTEAPTTVPTTTAPVVMPTVTPSMAPVAIPTFMPTEAPTTVPTTTAPVVMPTVTPSVAPVDVPTVVPTEAPITAVPATTAPVVAPTIVPSVAPAPDIPTLLPTEALITAVPTTTAPVVAPTIVPSMAPADILTFVPTETPTTAVPTTTAPVVTPAVMPSVAPVDNLTFVPTETLTAVPTTTAPVVTPIVAPSVAPVDIPTVVPTEAPISAVPRTTAPVITPTVAPSVAPADIPTVVPREAPITASPISAPTEIPKQCLVMVSNGQCSNLMATQEPRTNCDCHNFCNGEVSCCAFDEPCIVTCTGDFVAGCEIGDQTSPPSFPPPTPAPVGSPQQQTSAPPAAAPVGIPRQPFFFWPDGVESGAKPSSQPTHPIPTPQPTELPTTKAPTSRQPFFFWPGR